GKTTTMAGIVTSVLKTPSLGKHILVFEDPPEINYEGVKIAPGNSISVHEVGSVETDSDVQSFNQGLEAALRLRPDIIVQGEIRSKE
ncbi:Flp pilus assembly complex ATPase component TadA, partial [Vibrio alginolyticus]|nr:Flp pilus assembly complex ATPase component TadA [Vibrio alginolyticus]